MLSTFYSISKCRDSSNNISCEDLFINITKVIINFIIIIVIIIKITTIWIITTSLSGRSSSLPFLSSSCRAGGFWLFFFRVNGLAGPGSDRLANVKIISLPRGIESESSGIISSGCLCFYRV